MPLDPKPRITQNSQQAAIIADMAQARDRHPPILDQPSASIEEVVNPLNSPIQLCDPSPEPNLVHQPEDITDSEQTPTREPAQNLDPSTMAPPSTTSILDLALTLVLLTQSMAKSNLASIPVARGPPQD